MRTIIFAAAFAATSASAADLTMPFKAPPYVLDNFSGFYLGADAGRGWDDGNALFTPGSNPANFFDFKPSPRGFVAGAFAGYGRQFGAWYLGIEGDWNWSGVAGAVDIPPPDFSADQRTKWLASARGRIGYVTPWQALLYATGGWGWGGETFTLGAPGFSSAIQAASKTVTGWVAGGGIEIPIADKWSARLEYLHYHLGDLTVTDIPSDGPLNRISVHDQIDIVRGGISYRF